MADIPSILDYVAFIEDYGTGDVAHTQSTTLRFEGSTNSILSPNPDFLDWRKGDLLFITGTEHNDGVYKKANEADAFELVLESAYPGETASVITEDCNGTLVVINEVSGIGQGSMVVQPPTVSAHGLFGAVGQGSASLESLEASATGTGGAHGRCELPEIEADASGQQASFGAAELPAVQAEASACSGVQVTCELPSLEAWGWAEPDSGHADLTLPGLWTSGTANEDLGAVGKTVYGQANVSLPEMVGGDYSDADASLPELTVNAQVYTRVNGSCRMLGLEAKALSIGTYAYAFMPDFGVQATGVSGAQGTMSLPALTTEAFQGAMGRCSMPSLEAKAYDDSWPSWTLASGLCELPEIEVDAESVEPAQGDMELASLAVAAHAFANVVGKGIDTHRAIFANGRALPGRIGQHDAELPSLQASGGGQVKVVGNSSITLAGMSVMAQILSLSGGESGSDSGYPILSWNDDGGNWSWQS